MLFKLSGSDDGPVIRIPKSRIHNVKRDIRRALKNGWVTARALARIAGKCVAMTKVILPAKLLLRNIYRLLASRNSWQDCLQIDISSKQDLEWWVNSLSGWNGLVVQDQKIDVQITTDASASGWGATLGNLKAQGLWNTRLAHQHSNYRELFTILMAVTSFSPLIQNQRVQILSDNVTTVAYINRLGGAVKDFHCVMRAIWCKANHSNISLTAGYLSGPENWRANPSSAVDYRGY